MKIKPLYIYLPLAVVLLLFLFIYTNKNDKSAGTIPTGNIEDKKMPQDSIHEKFTNPLSESPSKSNVTENAKHETEMLKKQVEEHPNDTLKLKEYADFLSEHNPKEAIKYYDKLLRINPKRIDVLFSLSFIYYNQGNLSKTEELTNKILYYDKDNVKAYYNLGAIAASKGDKEKARQIWNKIVTEHPNDETAQLAKSSLAKL